MFFPYSLPAQGGAENATLNLAKALNEYTESKVRLYAFGKNGINSENLEGVKISRYSATRLPIVKDFSAKLAFDLRRSDEDVLHFQGAPRLLSRLLLSETVSGKVKVLTTHGLQESARILNASPFGSLIKPFFLRSLTKLDHIIALSKLDSDLILSFGLKKNRITIIPNGIDTSKFNKRRKFVVENSRKKILCVARFDKTKNYETLILLLKRLSAKLNIEAYLVGAVTDPEYFRQIAQSIKTNQIEDFVHLQPSLDDAALVDCYLSCDLFILPSLVETSPLVILEAMFAGLPIIATNVGGIPEMVKDNVNGFLVSPYDIQRMYEKSLVLLKNDSLSKEIGVRNRQLAEQFSWTKIALSTSNLYHRLVEEKHFKRELAGS
jgi:glycosyltransferase involved in cell wall biosynthesis